MPINYEDMNPKEDVALLVADYQTHLVKLQVEAGEQRRQPSPSSIMFARAAGEKAQRHDDFAKFYRITGVAFSIEGIEFPVIEPILGKSGNTWAIHQRSRDPEYRPLPLG